MKKIGYFLKNYYLNKSIYLLISVALFFISLWIIFLITDEIVLEKETYFDETIFSLFKNFIRNERLDKIVQTITNLSSPTFIKFFFPALVLLLFIIKQKKKAIFLFISGIGGIILLVVLKNIFARARPPYPLLFSEDGFSFPSGHATFSFVFYGAIAYLIWLTQLPKFLKLTLITLIVSLSIAIGISRIYLRVHYPSDVLAGFCLGYSWLLMMIYIYRKWFPLN
ncbi:phosphatase PAP2 family protein [Frigoriflavimonas asaccharolytica]|uniref:Undecaprenyl-diphosphatase n=1 Tax=Frigoriflavimonas asaccharolytica TaxID=2735899 RepID=A0A8J8G8H1_9FLAO|nr:phosphatase PAP2 family protein [Frigoriflavimonas asaccharolytica]NRS92886.1 undecaprenyl-diphosphatase [Frigoriflavimonas asaccharolytica]